MLSTRLSHYFTGGVRNRGRSYFQHGKVKILSIDANGSVATEVTGSEVYMVTLELERSGVSWEIKASCTCPYVDSNFDLCKHIWATVLAVETRPPFS